MNTKIFDIDISTLNKKDTFGYIYFWLYKNEKGFISTVNPEFLLLSKKDEDFKNILQKSRINTADGIGLIWASWFLSTTEKKSNILNRIYACFKWFFSLIVFLFYKKPFFTIIKERVPGSELIYDIVKIGNELNKKIFLLGSFSNEQLDIVENNLNKFLESQNIQSFTNIIAGKDIGFNPNEKVTDEEINKRLIEKINNSKAEIIFVALASPRQEIWINNNLDKLENIKLAIGVGGTFDFVAEYKKRAPIIFQKLGLEWLFRLLIEPQRWRRIFNAVVIFSINILKERL